MSRPFPQLNIKAYTFADVERVAKKHFINIKIADYNPDILGYYCTRKSAKRIKKFIVLNSMLDNIGKTFTGLHELAHYFLHVPVSSKQWFYCRRNALLTQSKHECEAHSFALIAMVPLPLLIDLDATSYEAIAPELIPFCKRRKKIWEQHEI